MEEEAERQEPRVAALLAINLVSQVLDEAYVIANAARESGEPWLYISMLKNLRNGGSYDVEDEDTTFVASKGDSDVNEDKMELVANDIATSTPQKLAGDRSYTTEANFIGQGDEEIEMEQGRLTKSTSVFINNMFDMSEVEHIIFCDDNIVKHSTESNELVTQTMTKIMESYINAALGIAFEEHPVNYGVSEIPSRLRSMGYSDYSFLDDAVPSDITKNIGICIQETNKCENEQSVVATTSIINDAEISLKNLEEYVDGIKQDEVAVYEDTYLTLNRDYEQFSDDGDPILQDPKELALQEIELMPANTSENNLTYGLEELEKPEEPTTIPAILETPSGFRKGGLVRRCRDQGARLWARLRGWWRRKTPGKHLKGHRVSTLGHGMCPLSPDARRRAASLLDQRLLCSPSPSRPSIWKFNTVNEALVNSSRWREYIFDTRTED